jgi:hypothetical protein
MDSHMVQILLPGLESSNIHTTIFSSFQHGTGMHLVGKGGGDYYTTSCQGIKLLCPKSTCTSKKQKFPLINLWSANFKCMEWFKSLWVHRCLIFKIWSKHQGNNCSNKRYHEWRTPKLLIRLKINLSGSNNGIVSSSGHAPNFLH